MPRVKVIVNGASGRTGSRLCAIAASDPRFDLVAALVSSRSAHLDRPALPTSEAHKTLCFSHQNTSHADIVIDFSSDEGARSAASIALDHARALLIATTGLSTSALESLKHAAKRIPVLIAPNTSPGVTLLAAAARALARALGPDYTPAIIESHHHRKKDAPSGTALRLRDALRDAGATIPDAAVLSIRGGDIVGEHTIRFLGPAETIELTHRAESRDLFARGALHASLWLVNQPPGLYSMDDVVAFDELRT